MLNRIKAWLFDLHVRKVMREVATEYMATPVIMINEKGEEYWINVK